MMIILAWLTMFASPASAEPAASAISREPFYAGIVARAGELKSETEALGRAPDVAVLKGAAFRDYAGAITALSNDDMKGHLDLKARGTDRDLKCILMGVSLDLPNKLKAIEAATTDDQLGTAYGDMAALLSDNIDVIVTPARTDSGLDCTLEFGDR